MSKRAVHIRVHVRSVACGLGHSLVIVDRSKLPEKLDKVKALSFLKQTYLWLRHFVFAPP